MEDIPANGQPAARHQHEGNADEDNDDDSVASLGRPPLSAGSTDAAAASIVPTWLMQGPQQSNSFDGETSMNFGARDFHASWSSQGPLHASAPPASFAQMHQSLPILDTTAGASSAPKSSSCSQPSSVIHDAARITNWETVLELCETEPEAARYAGRDGWTALHHACNRRCPYPDVVEALIRAYPDALQEEEDKGWTPLHYACRFKCTSDVVRLLIHMVPGKGKPMVSKKDRQGRTPLYYAVRYDAPPGVVGILLEVDATAVLAEDQNADSPLALVWDAWAEKMDGKRTLSNILPTEEEKRSLTLQEQAKIVSRRLHSQSRVLQRWNRVNMFLKAAFGFSVDEDWEKDKDSRIHPEHGTRRRSSSNRKWRVVHAAAAIKCHLSLFLLAAALHPEQAHELDQDDLQCPEHISPGISKATNLTALHLAASSMASGESGRLAMSTLLDLNPDAATIPASDGSLPLHRLAQNRKRCHWVLDGGKDLYLANTAAAQATDHNGQLPLHRAATAIVHFQPTDDEAALSGSVLRNLLNAFEEGASTADVFGCTPFHLAMAHGRTWDLDLQALLDAFPAAVQSRTGVAWNSQLPLHLACSNINVNGKMIARLLEANPDSVRITDRRGRLALHLACSLGLSWSEVVQRLVEADPATASEREANPRGWTALHMAVNCPHAGVPLIQGLVQASPASAGIATLQGRYPLHLACMSGKDWQGGLEDLFNAYPLAVSVPDGFGLLPFHIAALKYCKQDKEEEEVDGDQQRRSANSPRPHALDRGQRRISRTASSEAEQRLVQNRQDAREVGVLVDLLRANPTVII